MRCIPFRSRRGCPGAGCWARKRVACARAESQKLNDAEISHWEEPFTQRGAKPVGALDGGALTWACPMCPVRLFKNKRQLQAHGTKYHRGKHRPVEKVCQKVVYGTVCTRQRQLMKRLRDEHLMDDTVACMCGTGTKRAPRLGDLHHSAALIIKGLQMSPISAFGIRKGVLSQTPILTTT